MIVLSIIMGLSWIPLFYVPYFMTISLAEVAIVAASMYYLRLNFRLGLWLLLAFLMLDIIGRLIDNTWVALTLFGVGWIFQVSGHSIYEKNAPAFLKNFIHLLIGPLWIVSQLVRKD